MGEPTFEVLTGPFATEYNPSDESCILADDRTEVCEMKRAAQLKDAVGFAECPNLPVVC